MLQGLHVGIIGGRGIIGSWLVNLFAGAGASTSYVDPVEHGEATPHLTNELAKRARIIVLAVPLHVTRSVAEELVPIARKEQLFIDVCSLKSPLVDVFKVLPTEILSLHPMFSPQISDLRGEVISYVKVREGELSKGVLQLLRDEGFTLRELSLSLHDEIMARVQGMVHLDSLLFGEVLRRLGGDIGDDLGVATPNFRARLILLLRLLGQDRRLYGHMLCENAHLLNVIKIAIEVLNELLITIQDGNPLELVTLMDRLAAWLDTAGCPEIRRLEEQSGPLLAMTKGDR